MSGEEKTARPLEGVKVVEAGIALAGPFCGSVLADLGASVVKVERPDGGDPARLLGPAIDDTPLWWGVASRDKLCVSVDLKQKEGRDRFLSLIDDADVFVENYRPGVLDRLGLGWEELSKRNPRLVMMSISGFGQTGPNAGLPGFGKIAEGLSGIVPLTGAPDDTPLHVGFSLADTSAGLMGTMAITMALFQRDLNGGLGSRIDVGLYEPLFRMMELQFALTETSGATPKRNGTNDPYGWGARDASERRYVALTCRDDAEILVLLDARSHEPLARCVGKTVSLSPDELEASMREWASDLDLDEAGRLLRASKVQAARIHDGMSMAEDPYFLARGDVIWTTLNDDKRIAVPGHVPRSGSNMIPFRPTKVGDDDGRVFGDPSTKTAETPT
jgi:crotonobetainyl-CoA:carnitine CoA-transferase CaiB-like acyl-CoA transferase